MRKKRLKQLKLLIFIALLAVAIAYLGLSSLRGPAMGEFGTGRTDEISAVLLRQGDDRVVYLEIDEGAWILNHEYMAHMPAIRDLLSTLRRLEVRRPVSVSARDEKAEKLRESGVRVDVYSKGYIIKLPGERGVFPHQRRIRSFYVGGDDTDNTVTYMLDAAGNHPYEVHMPGVESSLAEVFEPDVNLWRDAVVLRLEPGDIARVEAELEGSSYTVESRGEEFIISDRQGDVPGHLQPDSSRIDKFTAGFSYLYYERLLPGSAQSPPGDILDDKVFLRLKVTDRDGNTTLLEFYRRKKPDDGSLVSEFRDYDPNRFYLRVDGGDYALAQYFIFQPVIRDLQWFF